MVSLHLWPSLAVRWHCKGCGVPPYIQSVLRMPTTNSAHYTFKEILLLPVSLVGKRGDEVYCPCNTFFPGRVHWW